VAIRRELRAVAPPVPLACGVWDGRWALAGAAIPGDSGLTIGALGPSGLAMIPDWRESGRPREALLTTPAIWRGRILVAAPLVRSSADFAFRRVSALAPPWEPALLR
jgi:tRNA(Ile)-lysidine synthase